MRSWLVRYVAVAGGALLGVPCAYAGAWLGDTYVSWFMSGGGGDTFFPPGIGLVAGVWLGALIGSRLAVRAVHVAATRRTTWALGVLLPLGIVLWPILGLILGSTPVAVPSLRGSLSLSGILIGLALLSRWIAERTTPSETPEHGGGRENTGARSV